VQAECGGRGRRADAAGAGAACCCECRGCSRQPARRRCSYDGCSCELCWRGDATGPVSREACPPTVAGLESSGAWGYSLGLRAWAAADASDRGHERAAVACEASDVDVEQRAVCKSGQRSRGGGADAQGQGLPVVVTCRGCSGGSRTQALELRRRGCELCWRGDATGPVSREARR